MRRSDLLKVTYITHVTLEYQPVTGPAAIYPTCFNVFVSNSSKVEFTLFVSNRKSSCWRTVCHQRRVEGKRS